MSPPHRHPASRRAIPRNPCLLSPGVVVIFASPSLSCIVCFASFRFAGKLRLSGMCVCRPANAPQRPAADAISDHGAPTPWLTRCGRRRPGRLVQACTSPSISPFLLPLPLLSPCGDTVCGTLWQHRVHWCLLLSQGFPVNYSPLSPPSLFTPTLFSPPPFPPPLFFSLLASLYPSTPSPALPFRGC